MEKVVEVIILNVLERWEDFYVKFLILCYKEYKYLFGKGKLIKKEIFGKIVFSFNK